METFSEFLQVIAILGTYGAAGTTAGLAMYRVLVTRGEVPGQSENLGPAALMAGVFWPIGLWVAIAMYLTGPHLPRRDVRELRKRSNQAMKDRELIKIQMTEHENEVAKAQLELKIDMFHDARMRAIEARQDGHTPKFEPDDWR